MQVLFGVDDDGKQDETMTNQATVKVTANQMRDQIAAVQYAMNSVKSCANTDNKIAEKKHLSNAIDELAKMTLARKSPELAARQESWLAEARMLFASSSDVAQVLSDPPAKGLALIKQLGG